MYSGSRSHMTNDIVQICYCAFKVLAPSQLFLQKNYETKFQMRKNLQSLLTECQR